MLKFLKAIEFFFAKEITMKSIHEKAIYLKLMVILVVVYCTMQASVAPLHTASPHSRSGTWIAFTSLKT